MANKYGVKEVADVTFYDLVTGKPLMYFDTLKMTTIENTAENSAARGGKGNSKLLQWDFNREASVTMQDALMSPKSIGLLTGNAVTTGATVITKREQLVSVVGAAGKSKVTLGNAPITGSLKAYPLATDGVTEVTTAPTIVGMDVSFSDTEVAVGATVVVYYTFTSDATAQTMKITADKFPGYVKVVGDTVIRNADTGIDEAFQIVIWKAKVSPNFNLTFQADGDPSVFDFNLDVFRRTQDAEMIQLIKY